MVDGLTYAVITADCDQPITSCRMDHTLVESMEGLSW